ncbi:hypothetical protein [Iamia sp.]|uniref:hypothetical protein n=1 Tax=Iamia sp. TaxID=2722710 RepID=UPI002B87D05D|nr:hypothetical protein [Iamia sp.]HXH56577.1 hypothetical protein [Iamia sp.]
MLERLQVVRVRVEDPQWRPARRSLLQLVAQAFDRSAAEGVEQEQQRGLVGEERDRITGDHPTTRLVAEPAGRSRCELGIDLDADDGVSGMGPE